MLDTGNNLVLSVETDRVINLNSSRYFLGVEGDKEVKIIRFQLDRYYCGIDLSVFKPRVNYKLSNSKEYYGEATIADFDEDYIYVEWTLNPSVTSVKGRVDFLVQLTKLDEDGSILKRYNSTMAMGRVEEGLNPEDQLPESMKKDILAIAEDALTQLKESKTEFDNRLKIISDKQNKIIVRLDATDLKINNFDENYETKMNDFHANYQEKMETFENDYNEKTSSAIKSIEDASTKSVTNVENARDEALENIQNKSTEFLNNIDEAENKAIKNIENSGEHYQEQINTLQQESAQQDEVLDKLNEEVDLKLTQPYLNNNDSTHITSSDNGSLKNIVVKGNTVQNSTKGLNLLDFNSFKNVSVEKGTKVNTTDNSITIKATENDCYTRYPYGFIKVEPNTKYTFLVEREGDFTGLCYVFYYSKINGAILQNVYFDGDSEIFTTPSDCNYISYRLGIDKSGMTGTYKNLMIIEGEQSWNDISYEPYTGGAPSPSPEYPQEIKAVSNLSALTVGKNLCGGYDFSKSAYGIDVVVKNSTININGTPAGNYPTVILYPNGDVVLQQWWLDSDSLRKKNIYKNKGFYAHDLKEKTLQIDFDGTFDVNGGELFYVVVGYETYGEYKNYSSKSTILFNLSTKERINYIAIGFTGTAKISNFNVKIQLKYDKNKSDFISYQGQSILNYTLQNPLYKLGDTQDYIDFNRGKIVRNIGVIVFNGSDDEGWCLSSTQYTNNIRFYTTILGDSTIHLNLLVLCNKFSYIKNMQGNDLMGISYTNTLDIQLDKSNLSTQDLTGFKTWLNKNPITVVYQLATPTEEDIPQELLNQLRALKSYYPQTNIMFDTEVEPYINFDYKLNLKSWIEDKDNKEIEYDKSVNDIQPYSDSYIEKWFNLMRTGRVYTVKFPLWKTSQSPIGEKLDANRGLICEPSTPVYAGQNDYDEIPVFKTFDVNAYVDNDGEVHLTAFKGDENFQDTGKVDVFVLTMSYYEKTWTEDGYWYYSISDSPKPGYTIAKECLKKDGSIRPYALYAKYVAGAIDRQPYSSKGLIPCYYPFEAISAYHMVSYCKQRGKYYTGGLMWDYKYIWTRFMLKFANTNSQAVLGGVFDYSFQYPITIAEENVKRAIVSKSNAARYVVGSCVSIGDWGDATSMDRSNKNCHNIARNVKILTIEDIDDSNSALNLDLAEPITTTTTCQVTTMHYLSGYSDEILGRDGSLGADPKSTKHPIVISGIECAVGGYEIPCNAMMNILNASGDREVYITNDATKLSTSTQTIMNTWKKSDMTIKISKVNSWQYITKMGIDTELGCVLPLAAGESGSGSSTGFGDGLYCDNAATGQREFLLLGALWDGSLCGLSCLSANLGFSASWWDFLARISIMAVRGE